MVRTHQCKRVSWWGAVRMLALPVLLAGIATQCLASDQMGVFSAGYWYLDVNGDGTWDAGDNFAQIGQAGDIAVVGDWNGSGTKKIGIFRNGLWVLDYNGNGVWDGTTIDRAINVGQAGDIPVVGDWNGDGRDKVGVFRNGTWYLDYNGDGGTSVIAYLGQSGDIPVVGDWNKSGKTKIGIFRNGMWLLDYNGNGAWDGPGIDVMTYLGQSGDIPVVGDWNGSGSTKIGIFRSGLWVLDYNGNFQWDGPPTDVVATLGQSGDVPVIGDWNGSGTKKIGVFRSGLWVLDYNGNFQWDGEPVDRYYGFVGTGDAPVVGKWMAPTAPPSLISVTPSGGTGSQQTFTLLASDPDGGAFINTEQLLFANTSGGSGSACYFWIDQGWKWIFLRDDGNTTWGQSVTAGQAGTVPLSNSQCSLDGAASSIAVSGVNGVNLTVNLALTFTPAFAGTHNITMEAVDWMGVGVGATNWAWTVASPVPGTGEASLTAVPNGKSSGGVTDDGCTGHPSDVTWMDSYITFDTRTSGTNISYLLHGTSETWSTGPNRYNVTDTVSNAMLLNGVNQGSACQNLATSPTIGDTKATWWVPCDWSNPNTTIHNTPVYFYVFANTANLFTLVGTHQGVVPYGGSTPVMNTYDHLGFIPAGASQDYSNLAMGPFGDFTMAGGPTVSPNDGVTAQYLARSNSAVSVHVNVPYSAQKGWHQLGFPAGDNFSCPVANQFLAVIVYDATPVVASVSPTTIPVTVPTTLTITGSGFGDHPTVFVGGTPYNLGAPSRNAQGQDVVTVSVTLPSSAANSNVAVYLQSNGAGGQPFYQPQGTQQGSRTSNTVQVPARFPTVKLIHFAWGNNQQLWKATTFASNGDSPIDIVFNDPNGDGNVTINEPAALEAGWDGPYLSNIVLQTDSTISNYAELQVVVTPGDFTFYTPVPLNFVNGWATIDHIPLSSALPPVILSGAYQFQWQIRFASTFPWQNFRTTTHLLYFVHGYINNDYASYKVTTKRLGYVAAVAQGQSDLSGTVAQVSTAVNIALGFNPQAEVDLNNVWAIMDRPYAVDCESLSALAAAELQQLGYGSARVGLAYPTGAQPPGATDATTKETEYVNDRPYSLTFRSLKDINDDVLGGNYFEGFVYLSPPDTGPQPMAATVAPQSGLLGFTSCNVSPPTTDNLIQFRVLTSTYHLLQVPYQQWFWDSKLDNNQTAPEQQLLPDQIPFPGCIPEYP